MLSLFCIIHLSPELCPGQLFSHQTCRAQVNPTVASEFNIPLADVCLKDTAKEYSIYSSGTFFYMFAPYDKKFWYIIQQIQCKSLAIVQHCSAKWTLPRNLPFRNAILKLSLASLHFTISTDWLEMGLSCLLVGDGLWCKKRVPQNIHVKWIIPAM